tara:strand:+ start:540 stop:752 length:213 start_codon:yes stop_codon:yes gene_type:complete
MYVLIVKDGLAIRYIGPYLNTKHASDDLQRVLSSCSNRANWQIHALEKTTSEQITFRGNNNSDEYIPKAS